jgi:hypothetical protein
MSQVLPKGITSVAPGAALPKGITRLSSAHPGGTVAAQAQLAANIASAAQMHMVLGQEIEIAADWLMRTEPGKFASLAAAVAELRQARAAI